MKKYLFLLFFTPVFTNAQELPCATKATPEQIAYMANRPKQAAFKRVSTPVRIPVLPYIARMADSSGGLDTLDFYKELDSVNTFYKNSGIEFYVCKAIQFIDSDELYDYDPWSDGTLPYQDKVINIYFFNTVSYGGSPVCGYSHFPPSIDEIVISNSCATNGSTLAHEFGHYFSLPHTHGNGSFTDELADGSNCEYAGDELCDTPADPNLSGKVDNTCTYIGTEQDVNGDPFDPQVSNIMSYSLKKCRNLFTVLQYERMNLSMQFDRNYLCCDVPLSNYGYEINTFQVSFKDSSLDATAHSWAFGDGTYSIEKDPVHTYASPGNYIVYLTTSNDCGIHTINKTVQITGINAGFMYAVIGIKPNPAKEYITFSVPRSTGLHSISLFNSLGQRVIFREHTFSGREQSYALQIGDILPGAYVLKITGDNQMYTGRVIVAD